MRRIVLFTPNEIAQVKELIQTIKSQDGLAPTSLKSQDDSEFEVRFQRSIVPLTQIRFSQLLYLASLKSESVQSIENTTYIKADIRKIVEQDGSVVYQQKTKDQPVDVRLWSIDQPQGFVTARFSCSKELPSSEQEYTQIQAPVLTRIKKRSRFALNDFYIDLTSVLTVDEKANEKLTFEVEVEFKLEKIKEWLKTQSPETSLLQSFSVAFGILYPDIHTILSVERSKQFNIPKRGVELTRETRPVNIQSKHTNQPYMQHMALTNKLDGVAYYVCIDHLKSRIFLFNNKDFWFLKPMSKPVFTQSFVCMSEVVVKESIVELHLFDTIATNASATSKWDTSCTSLPLVERISLCKTANKIIDDCKISGLSCEVKQFFTSADVVKNVHDAVFYCTSRYGLLTCSTTNDGFIFEPLNPTYKGLQVPTLKWKFPTHISIDFRFKLQPSTEFGWSTYHLYMASKSGESLFMVNNEPAKLVLPNENRCDGIVCSELDGVIGEVIYRNARFELLRLRLEKIKPNFEQVVNETFADMLNPPTLPSILKQIQTISQTDVIAFNLDANEQPDISFADFANLVAKQGWTKINSSWQSAQIGFPYFRYFMGDVMTYFKNLTDLDCFDSQRIVTTEINSEIAKMPHTPDWYFKFSDISRFVSSVRQGSLTIMSQPSDFLKIDCITNWFTEPARMKAVVNKPYTNAVSPLTYWNNYGDSVLSYLYEKQLDVNSKNCREAMFDLCPEATLFKTTVVKTIFDAYEPTRILDWCSGWGDRLIGACAYAASSKKRITYIGFDPNSELQSGYSKIISTLAPKSSNFSVTCAPFEQANIDQIAPVDLVFTSPPYFDFEIYTSEATQSIVSFPDYKSWMKGFFLPCIIKAFSCLREGGNFIIHIANTKQMPNLVSLMTQFIQTGMKYKFIGSIFTQSTDSSKSPKPMWVFQKTKTFQKEETVQKANQFFKDKLGFAISDVVVSKISTTTLVTEKQPAQQPQVVMLPKLEISESDLIEALTTWIKTNPTNSLILVEPSLQLLNAAVALIQTPGSITSVGSKIDVNDVVLGTKVLNLNILPDLDLQTCCQSPNPLQFLPKAPIFLSNLRLSTHLSYICSQSFPHTVFVVQNLSVWNNIQRNLQFPDYVTVKQGEYNIIDITPKHNVAFRKAFNIFKRQYISEFCKGKVVLDIGSGRGGDIEKYVNAGAKHLYFVEPNNDFIEESKERYKPHSKKISISFLPYGGQQSELIQENIKQPVDVVFMMFSLTNFFQSEQYLNMLVTTISNNLSKNGDKLVVTVMDGYRVNELLNSSGVDKITNDSFTIERRSKSQDKQGFGDLISFNLSQSKTAVDLTEYLVYPDVLSKQLERKGIFLQRIDRVDNQPDFSSEESILASCYEGLVYIKGQPLWQDSKLFRIKTTGDGSCFFHAVCQSLLGPMYRDVMGIDLRRTIAESFTVDDYAETLRGFKATMDWYETFEKAQQKRACDVSKAVWERIKTQIDKVQSDYIIDKISQANLDNTERDICIGLFMVGYNKALATLRNCKAFSTEFVIDYLESYLNINVIQFVSNVGKFVKNGRWKDGPVVPIYNQANVHYETIRWAGNDIGIISLQTGIEWVFTNNIETINKTI